MSDRSRTIAAGTGLVVCVGLFGALSRHEQGSSIHFTRIDSAALTADTSASPSASWIDVDEDGDDDLYVLNGYGSLEEPPLPQANILYRNDDGRLTPLAGHALVRDTAFSGSATWGDYDNDGDADVFVANQLDARNFLYRNDGAGVFTRLDEGPVAQDRGRSFSAVWVDVDGDGWLDLYVANGRSGGGQGDFLYRNLGDGRFARVVDAPFVQAELASGGGTWGDFDADGDPDLFLPLNSDEPNRLYRNDGDWNFVELGRSMLGIDPLPGKPNASVGQWVDYDDDQDLDLFVGNAIGVVDFVYRNHGGGRLERAVAGRIGLDATYVSDALWLDLDNDADLDLAIAVWGGASELYENDGSGRLSPVHGGGFGSTIDFASSVSASDVDGDGDLDLLLTHWPVNEAGGMPNQLYRNDSGAGNWLKVRLRGTTSNRSGIGAAVQVTARIRRASRAQTRLVTARASWRSANSLTQHFGLADAQEVDRISVVWPSGRVDTLDGPIAANQTLTIVEGERQPR